MFGCRNKVNKASKCTNFELDTASSSKDDDPSTSFLTSSFYSSNKTTANVPLVDLAYEHVTFIPEFESVNSSVESDYSPSSNSNSDNSDSDWDFQSNITPKVSGVNRRCSKTKNPISKKRKVSDAKKSCSNIKGITAKGLAKPRGRPKKEKKLSDAAFTAAAPAATAAAPAKGLAKPRGRPKKGIKLSDDSNRDLQTFVDAGNSTQTESSTVDAAAPAATAAAPASAAAAAASSGENDKPASAAADAASSGVTSAASAAPDAVDSAENSSSQNEITITAAAAVTSAAPAAPAATAAPASAAAASSGQDDTPKFTKKSRVKNRNPNKHWNNVRKTKKKLR